MIKFIINKILHRIYLPLDKIKWEQYFAVSLETHHNNQKKIKRKRKIRRTEIKRMNPKEERNLKS